MENSKSSDKRVTATWFQRYLLPGFAFKAFVIGGGYATGRELAEFFLPSGPWGGIAAMVLATALWSVVAILTFLLAHRNGTYDYQSFFQRLLGPGWIVFECAYGLLVIVVLSVFGAAAGAIGHAVFTLPAWAGTYGLMLAIAGFVAFGTKAIERLFKYVSILLYGVYSVFALLALTRFGPLILHQFALGIPATGWVSGGLAYSGYNIIAAVIILPVLRHLTSDRDAVVAGALAGPLAMLPALIFFTCMVAFYPSITDETLPSDFMLRQLNAPTFHVIFQIMIFAALLESGAGALHAINERIAKLRYARHRTELRGGARFCIAIAILFGCVVVAEEFGLVRLIAEGYRFLSYVFLAIYVAPLLTIGVWQICRRKDSVSAPG